VKIKHKHFMIWNTAKELTNDENEKLAW